MRPRVAVAAGAAMLLAGCGPRLIVGHSLTQQAFDPDADGTFVELNENTEVHAYMGWDATDVLGFVQDKEGDFDLVIDLVINDATPLWGGDGWDERDVAAFQAVLDAAPGCVVMVLPGFGPDAHAGLVTESREARDVLAVLASARPDTHLVDWQDVIDAKPWVQDDDGVHLLTPTSPAEDLAMAAAGQLPRTDPAAAAERRTFLDSSTQVCA